MPITIPVIMREINNFFPYASQDAAWTIESAAVTPALPPGQWIAITGSVHNNGVHQLTDQAALPGAQDESWSGRVWLLAPPADFLDLCARIAAWGEQHQDASLLKESFGAYSRTNATTTTGRALTWQEAFASELRPYRCMFSEVKL